MKIAVLVIGSLFISFSSFGQCWTQVSSGIFHTMALKSDGTLWAWGENEDGQLGNGTTQPSESPVQIGFNNDWKQVSVGRRHTIGLKEDGSLWTWGANYWGQLGDTTTTDKSHPIQIAPHKTWIKISAGSDHNLALASDSSVWAWGHNLWGQLTLSVGQFGVVFSSELVHINELPDAVDISAGSDYNMVIRSDGSLWGWGHNENGQLGIGPINQNTFYRIQPTQAVLQAYWKLVSTGSYHSASIDLNGELYTWGDNSKGQLGDGTMEQKTSPHLIDSNVTWLNFSCGFNHTLSLKSDSTIWACGSNSYGQLGDGSGSDQSVFQLLDPVKKWKYIGAGSSTSFAIDTEGRLFAWGNNEYGQLGLGDRLNRDSPIEITCPSSGTGSPHEKEVFALLPNPAINDLRIVLSQFPIGKVTYKIISIHGRTLLTGELNLESQKIELANLPPGTYAVVLRLESGITARLFQKL